MKILLTGGGTGGHFYPLIAVAEEINRIAEEKKLADVSLYYFSDSAYDPEALFANRIVFKKIATGKMRAYVSLQNFFDIFKTIAGMISGVGKVFSLYPDVVFAKGGYASFPTLLAARLFGIPVIIHESDSVPGRVTKWAGKFAKFVAVSYTEAAEFFPPDRVAHTGQPIRKDIVHPEVSGASEYLGLSAEIPTILIVGGSSGAEKINDAVLGALPEILKKFQVIHQTGKSLFKDAKARADILIEHHENKHFYKPFPFLDPLAMRMAAGAAKAIITRAGSQLFEIASWQVPAIVVPISKSVNDHQRKNAYNFARAGCGVVVEESNLTPHLLVSESERLIERVLDRTAMQAAQQRFFKPNASRAIAEKVIEIGLSHEK